MIFEVLQIERFKCGQALRCVRINQHRCMTVVLALGLLVISNPFCLMSICHDCPNLAKFCLWGQIDSVLKLADDVRPRQNPARQAAAMMGGTIYSRSRVTH